MNVPTFGVRVPLTKTLGNGEKRGAGQHSISGADRTCATSRREEYTGCIVVWGVGGGGVAAPIKHKTRLSPAAL